MRPDPFAEEDSATRWLEELHDDAEREDSEVDDAVRILNRALRADRAACTDPSAREVSPGQALVVRLGFGAGEAVADGHYDQAWEFPHERHGRVRRSMEAPEERFAALLGGREPLLVCEELVLRARADLSARRAREAALQAGWRSRAFSPSSSGMSTAITVAPSRPTVPPWAVPQTPPCWEDLEEEAVAAVEAAVGRMEAALRVRRLQGAP